MKENFNNALHKASLKVHKWLDSIIENLPEFLAAIVVMLFFIWLSKVFRKNTRSFFQKRIKQVAVRDLVVNFISGFIVLLGFLLVLDILNLDKAVQSLLAGVGIAGLGISLALQSSLTNTLSGIYMALNDVINVGDYIDTNGYSGFVVEIGMRNTQLRENDNNIVIIPNNKLLDNPFKNYGLTKRARPTIHSSIAMTEDLDLVQSLVVGAVEEVFPPKNEDKIQFYYDNFKEGKILFRVTFWNNNIPELTNSEARTMAIKAIKKAMQKNNITLY